MSEQVWFITGCSTGFGRELARIALERGHKTVVTARNPDQVKDLVAGHEDKALALKLDVTDPEQVASAVKSAEDHFGAIDVLINNAGIGYFGAMEESDLDEVRRMFEINFWGLVDMTRTVLPGMRKRRTGTIVNISSIAGLVGFPALSFYHATKFAVEGLSESLSKEVDSLGIKVMIVEPGPFRTDWAGRSANEVTKPIDDYQETAGARRETIRDYSGHQPGDPIRGAKAIIDAVESGKPPLRMLLGKFAWDAAMEKLDMLRQNFIDVEKIAKETDYPENEQ